MSGNVLGKRFVVVSFGESHGRCVGVVVDGCPAGLPFGEHDVQKYLDLRRPGTSRYYTSRLEPDEVDILSGVFNGYTTGAPIAMVVWNRDVDSDHYSEYHRRPRPGHADYVARVKYDGFNDWRGGGRFSGRITLSHVMAGSLAIKLLEYVLSVKICAYTKRIGDVEVDKITYEKLERRYSNPLRCPDPVIAKKMEEVLNSVMASGDSIGGVVEVVILNVPVGIGEPVFDGLEQDLSKALFSIPGVKGVEFGAGFVSSKMRGSEFNDRLVVRGSTVRYESNNMGGIVGGLSNGMPIIVRVAFRPPSSISIPQKTVDLETLKEVDITVRGRHDPCIVPRAVPVVEATVAIVLADHATRYGLIPPVLSKEYGKFKRRDS